MSGAARRGSTKALVGSPSTRPFSPALAAGPFIFVSGQVGTNQAGELAGETVTSQTTQVLNNLAAILAEAGLDLDDVVKTTVFLTDIKDFAAMNETYRQRFTAPLPTRSTVEVSALARSEFKVEIDAIAVRREVD